MALCALRPHDILSPVIAGCGLGSRRASGDGAARPRAPCRFVRTDVMTYRPRYISWLAQAAIVLGLVTLLGACADETRPAYREGTVESLYNEAMDNLYARMYDEAAAMFHEVQRQHPYSVWAIRAQLMSAYAYYRNDQYDEATIAARRFIQLHPGHADVAYAYVDPRIRYDTSRGEAG